MSGRSNVKSDVFSLFSLLSSPVGFFLLFCNTLLNLFSNDDMSIENISNDFLSAPASEMSGIVEKVFHQMQPGGIEIDSVFYHHLQ